MLNLKCTLIDHELRTPIDYKIWRYDCLKIPALEISFQLTPQAKNLLLKGKTVFYDYNSIFPRDKKDNLVKYIEVTKNA